MKARCSENRAAQGFRFIILLISNFLDLIKKPAPARSVKLKAVYLKALLYFQKTVNIKIAFAFCADYQTFLDYHLLQVQR